MSVDLPVQFGRHHFTHMLQALITQRDALLTKALDESLLRAHDVKMIKACFPQLGQLGLHPGGRDEDVTLRVEGSVQGRVDLAGLDVRPAKQRLDPNAWVLAEASPAHRQVTQLRPKLSHEQDKGCPLNRQRVLVVDDAFPPLTDCVVQLAGRDVLAKERGDHLTDRITEPKLHADELISDVVFSALNSSC